jgi:hypothetical protein
VHLIEQISALSPKCPVLAAGEIELVGDEVSGYNVIDLNVNSGHYMFGNSRADNATAMKEALTALKSHKIKEGF